MPCTSNEGLHNDIVMPQHSRRAAPRRAKASTRRHAAESRRAPSLPPSRWHRPGKAWWFLALRSGREAGRVASTEASISQIEASGRYRPLADRGLWQRARTAAGRHGGGGVRASGVHGARAARSHAGHIHARRGARRAPRACRSRGARLPPTRTGAGPPVSARHSVLH